MLRRSTAYVLLFLLLPGLSPAGPRLLSGKGGPPAWEPGKLPLECLVDPRAGIPEWRLAERRDWGGAPALPATVGLLVATAAAALASPFPPPDRRHGRPRLFLLFHALLFYD